MSKSSHLKCIKLKFNMINLNNIKNYISYNSKVKRELEISLLKCKHIYVLGDIRGMFSYIDYIVNSINLDDLI